MATEEGWVGIAEVAAHLQVTKESIYRWVDTKGLPAHRVGRLLRFRLSQVDEWVQSNTSTEPEGRSLGVSGRPNKSDQTDG